MLLIILQSILQLILLLIRKDKFMTNSEKVRENKMRRAAKRQGFILRKSRAKYVYPHSKDFGGYMILDASIGYIVIGERFGLSLEDVEEFLMNPSAEETEGAE